MGKITFHTRPEISRLVIVDSESQAEDMLTLKDLDGKPFPVFPDTQLNTRTGTILIPNEICQVDVSWPYLSELIADKHDITHVFCFIINFRGHRRYPANTAKITFKGQDLPDNVQISRAFYKVKPYSVPHCQCHNCWTYEHPVK